jgi:hypothetical protein
MNHSAVIEHPIAADRLCKEIAARHAVRWPLWYRLGREASPSQWATVADLRLEYETSPKQSVRDS